MMIRVSFILAMVMLALAVDSPACVGCREPGFDTVTNEPQTVLAGFGFSWGVLIMLGCALGVVGSMVTYIWRTVVRIERERGGL